jgi:hypothetical protein
MIPDALTLTNIANARIGVRIMNMTADAKFVVLVLITSNQLDHRREAFRLAT